ncbi:hypothetical protein [Streptomyces sp. NPDC059378]|uniref:hypothetical protein n=1 Tax=Streptomyces sp. NPDC059378 TaxID=3346815 RepID=UPI0036CDB5D9
MTSIAFESGSPRTFVDPYAVDSAAPAAWASAWRRKEEGDYFLPAPDPAQRLDFTIDPRDRRRLELLATLTMAGIPPRPEDREAIDQLSALPGSVNVTLQRWLNHTG